MLIGCILATFILVNLLKIHPDLFRFMHSNTGRSMFYTLIAIFPLYEN